MRPWKFSIDFPSTESDTFSMSHILHHYFFQTGVHGKETSMGKQSSDGEVATLRTSKIMQSHASHPPFLFLLSFVFLLLLFERYNTLDTKSFTKQKRTILQRYTFWNNLYDTLGDSERPNLLRPGQF